MFVKPEGNDKANFNRNIKVTAKEHTSNLRPERKSRGQKLKEIGSSALKLYASLDMFGKPIILRYDGQEVFKSIYGTTMSLSVLGLMLAFFIISFALFVQRKNLSFSFLSESKPTPDKFDFGLYNGTLEWIVGVDIINEDVGVSANDPSLFTFSINYKSKGISDKNLEPILLPCSNSSSFMTKLNSSDPNSDTYYDLYQMYDPTNEKETTQCFRLNKFKNKTDGTTFNMTLEGNEISELHTYVSIRLDVCSNETAKIKGITCATPEIIKQNIDASAVRFYFTHERFFPDGKVSYPVVNSTLYYRYNIQKYFSQKYDIYLQQNRINDFWDIMKVQPTIKLLASFSDDYDFTLDFVPENDFGKLKFPLLELTINADKVKNTFVRKFMNIKEFFVDVVGILNGLWAGGKAVGQIINAMLLKRDLINKSFWVMDEDEQEQEQNKKKEVNIQKNDGKATELSSVKKKTSFQILDQEINRSNSINKSNRGLLEKKDKEKLNPNEINKNLENSLEDESMLSETSTNNKENEVKVAGYISNRWFNSESLLLPIQTKKFTHFNMTFKQLIMSMFPCFKDKKLIANKKIFTDCGQIIENYFNIETIISGIREYENLRNVVLTPEEYKILKMITTPKIEIKGEDIVINKPEKQVNSGDNLKTMFLQYAQSVNRLVRTSHLTTAEYNLLELHKIAHLGNKNKEKKP